MNDRTRRTGKALAVGLLTALAGVLLGLTDAGTTFERSVGLSWLFNIRGPVAPPPDVAVVAIDGRTGDQLGLPSLPREWPRSTHARLVDELTRRGAAAIVFDMQFDKPKAPDDDRTFARAVDASDRVVLIELVTGKRQPVADADGKTTGTVWVEELVQPLPMLIDAAKGLATFPLPKIDASVYEFWVFKESVGDAPTLPAVALQVHALKVHQAWMSLLRRVDPTGFDGVPGEASGIGKAAQLHALMGGFRSAFEKDPGAADRLKHLIALDPRLSGSDEGRLLRALTGLYGGDPHRLLNFYGPPGTIPTVPYQDVLGGREAGGFDFRGKTVFVGFSDLYDPGHPDRFYTVFTNADGVDLSGVEIAATAFGNLMTDRSTRTLDGMQMLAVLLGFGLIAGSLAYLLPAVAGVPLVIILAGAYAHHPPSCSSTGRCSVRCGS